MRDVLRRAVTWTSALALGALIGATVVPVSAARLEVTAGTPVLSGAASVSGCVTIHVTLGHPTPDAVECTPPPASPPPVDPPLGTRILCAVTTPGVSDSCTARLVIDSQWGTAGDRAMSGRFDVTTTSGKPQQVDITIDLSAHLGWSPAHWTTWQGWTATRCGTGRTVAHIPVHVSDFGFQAFEVAPSWAAPACV